MYPRPLPAVSHLKGADFSVALKRQCDFVKPVQQASATARIDLEAVPLA
jgi:hypothetical protein